MRDRPRLLPRSNHEVIRHVASNMLKEVGIGSRPRVGRRHQVSSLPVYIYIYIMIQSHSPSSRQPLQLHSIAMLRTLRDLGFGT